MKVSEIVRQVRSAIDELMKNDSEFLRVSNDELNLEQVIVDKIGYGLQYVVENASLDRLDGDSFETLTTEELAGFAIDATSLVGRLKLPKDLLRIIEARLSSWPYFPIPESDRTQVALMQHDEYARGSWDRPVNILTYSDGDRYLEMYCAKEASDTLNFVFIRKPDVEDYSVSGGTDPEVSVPTQLESALIYQVAGLSMVAFRDDVASSLFAIAQRFLEPAADATGTVGR